MTPLGLTALASATDATIQEKLWTRHHYIDNLKQRNENIREIVKYHEESGLLYKGVSKAIQNDGTLGGLLGNSW